jgi:plasmid stability protein
MASVTIKNIPDGLYKKLKARAKVNHRSINGEIVNVLQRDLSENVFNVKEFLERARKIRERINITFTDEEILAAKKEGRA